MEKSLAHLYSVKSDINHVHTPESIGAAASIHTHTKSQITDFAHSHGDAELSSMAWSKLINTPITIAGYGIVDAVNTNLVVTSASPNKILKLNADGDLPANITGNAMKAYSVDWSGVNNKPNNVSGYGLTDVYTKSEVDNKAFIAAIIFG
jgi:hypothetical protein